MATLEMFGGSDFIPKSKVAPPKPVVSKPPPVARTSAAEDIANGFDMKSGTKAFIDANKPKQESVKKLDGMAKVMDDLSKMSPGLINKVKNDPGSAN